MFHHLDFPRLFLCESTGYSKHKTTGIASVAICGGSNHILTGLLVMAEPVHRSLCFAWLFLFTSTFCCVPFGYILQSPQKFVFW